MSNPRHTCYPNAKALLGTCAQSSSIFSASTSFSLVLNFLRRLPVCRCRSRPLLVSLHRWNLMRHVLRLDSTICSAYISLLGIYIEFVRSAKTAGHGRFGNRHNRRGGKPTSVAVAWASSIAFQLGTTNGSTVNTTAGTAVWPTTGLATTSSPPANGSAATSATPARPQQSTPPSTKGRGRGRGNKV